jgi:hypothetical protein
MGTVFSAVLCAQNGFPKSAGPFLIIVLTTFLPTSETHSSIVGIIHSYQTLMSGYSLLGSGP